MFHKLWEQNVFSIKNIIYINTESNVIHYKSTFTIFRMNIYDMHRRYLNMHYMYACMHVVTILLYIYIQMIQADNKNALIEFSS